MRVSEHRDTLLSIRDGKTKWEDVNTWRIALHREFEEAFEKTRLPTIPTMWKRTGYSCGRDARPSEE